MAQLDLLQAGNPPETIAAAEAAGKAALAGVMPAKAALAENELRAPFVGTVAALEVKAGEEVTPGAALVQLGDLTAWHIETTDLTELNVVNVRIGDSAQISFDALPGHVTSIESCCVCLISASASPSRRRMVCTITWPRSIFLFSTGWSWPGGWSPATRA